MKTCEELFSIDMKRGVVLCDSIPRLPVGEPFHLKHIYAPEVIYKVHLKSTSSCSIFAIKTFMSTVNVPPEKNSLTNKTIFIRGYRSGLKCLVKEGFHEIITWEPFTSYLLENIAGKVKVIEGVKSVLIPKEVTPEGYQLFNCFAIGKKYKDFVYDSL